jgi:hypothetical protein
MYRVPPTLKSTRLTGMQRMNAAHPDTEDLLHQFIREALLTKASGLSTKLYDQ